MSYKNPQISSYLVCRLRQSTCLHYGKRVPRKAIYNDYMTVKAVLPDAYDIVCDIAKKCKCSVLMFSSTHQCYFPLFNFDREVSLLLK